MMYGQIKTQYKKICIQKSNKKYKSENVKNLIIFCNWETITSSNILSGHPLSCYAVLSI